MNYIRLCFETPTEDDADLVMALLGQLEVQGFEQTASSLYAYFYEDKFLEDEVKTCLKSTPWKYTKAIIRHENWNAAWESNFEPVQIGNEVGIRAHFHPPFKDCNYEIVITPKMSFGTGHHETTQMMLEYACTTSFNGKSVFDFGCGTGVLAIFAAMKNAHPILAIDNDPWSIENAIENCERNNCKQIDVSITDLSNIEQSFDIILANINLNVLIETLPFLKKLLHPGGHIYLSGILETDLPEMAECIAVHGLKIISQKIKGNWLSLHIN